MELTKKQIILISVISGLILLLTVAAVLIFTPGDEDEVPEPTATPTATASPTPTNTPAPTPSPTAFRLPLVPQGDTPQPASSPEGSDAFAPQTWPGATEGPWVAAKKYACAGHPGGRPSSGKGGRFAFVAVGGRRAAVKQRQNIFLESS